MTALRKQEWHLWLPSLLPKLIHFTHFHWQPVLAIHFRERKLELQLLVFQLKGAPTNPVLRTLIPSLTCPSSQSDPCSWLLGVVNQHSRLLKHWGVWHSAQTAFCPSNEAKASVLDKWERNISELRPAFKKRSQEYDSIPEQWWLCIRSSKQTRFSFGNSHLSSNVNYEKLNYQLA